MNRVVGQELQGIQPFFEMAAAVAKEATCHRQKCGSVIIQDGVAIGKGYNSPPLDDETSRMCGDIQDYSKKPKYDKTCCIHAEWRAVIDACKRNADKITGSTLYFMRLDEHEDFSDAGDPFCTVCSRLAMEAGVAQFALWNNNGADIYTLKEYNQRSYDFYLPKKGTA